jgi:hypothetical protein
MVILEEQNISRFYFHSSGGIMKRIIIALAFAVACGSSFAAGEVTETKGPQDIPLASGKTESTTLAFVDPSWMARWKGDYDALTYDGQIMMHITVLKLTETGDAEISLYMNQAEKSCGGTFPGTAKINGDKFNGNTAAGQYHLKHCAARVIEATRKGNALEGRVRAGDKAWTNFRLTLQK